MVQRIAVIGAGPAGRAFALRCALAGLDVVLEDVMPSNLRRAQDDYAALASGTGRIDYASTVEEAVREADLAIDFVPDELESKLEIFSLVDRMAPPKTILLTPTRALSITDLASCTYRAPLCVAARSDLGSILEGPVTLLRSRFVAEEAMEATAALFAQLGVATISADDNEEPMLVKNAPMVRNFDLS
jgi:3-hydroxybutyryl-CoA dehydrogenase